MKKNVVILMMAVSLFVFLAKRGVNETASVLLPSISLHGVLSESHASTENCDFECYCVGTTFETCEKQGKKYDGELKDLCDICPSCEEDPDCDENEDPQDPIT